MEPIIVSAPDATQEGNRIFLTAPEGLLMEPTQVDDAVRAILTQLAALGVTLEEAVLLREHYALKAGQAAHLNGIGRAISLLRNIPAHIILSTLPSSGFTKANTALAWRWEQDSETTRLDRLQRQFGGIAKVPDLDIKKHSAYCLPGSEHDFWMDIVDVLIWAGIDYEEFLKADVKDMNPKAVQAYCKLLQHLTAIPNLTPGDYFEGCIKLDGAVPHPDCIRASMKMKSTQTTGGVLTVHYGPVNPSMWFHGPDDVTYSIAPTHVPGIVNDLPAGNKVKQAVAGDMITVAAFTNMNPFVTKQIADGTAPRIDIATKLRRGSGFSFSPYALRYDSRAYIDSCWSGIARVHSGSFVAAWE